jgi:NDP-sugar pyrophosphorylase family protein
MLIKKAFVLGAGLGTRLRPLTETTPKPMIPIFNKPLITFALDHLIAVGVESFVVNTHRLAEQFAELFGSGYYLEKPIALIHEPVLLETGGGIKNAESLLRDGPFITYSGDVLSDVSVENLIEEHFLRGNDVTLGLRNTGLASSIAVQGGRIIDLRRKSGGGDTYDFANIAVWNSEIFSRLRPNEKISFIPVLADWITENAKIGGVVLDQGKWFNVGSRTDYLEVHRTILKDKWRPPFVHEPEWPQPIHPTAEIAPDAKLQGCIVIGRNCRVGPEAVLEDTILWTGAQIASRSHVSGCIVRSHQALAGVYRDAVI